MPDKDIAGLHAVGLVPSTRKDCWANARYFYSEIPTIHIYSIPDKLQYRLPSRTKRSDIELGLAIELQFGMTIETQGSRHICAWSACNLREFILAHVLTHEIGHHIYHSQRRVQGINYRPNTQESEQFAEAYAVRCRRNRS